ncbi:MAG: primosomal protein N' [Puniceicoccales bacterium]|jgi:primosomal protein N' (replication factor Y)|nr:primosomal protein N' [Puniceicoccales bacterium]
MNSLCAEVLTFGIFDKPLLYKIPPALAENLTNGMLVQVPFGRQKTLGVIVKIYETDVSESSFRVKEVLGATYRKALLGRDLMELIFWIGKYYAASYKSILETIIPIAVRRNVASKLVAKFSLLRTLADGECATLKKRSPKQFHIYDFFIKNGKTFDKAALGEFSASALLSMVERGIIAESVEEVSRTVYDGSYHIHGPYPMKKFTMTDEQRLAASDISESLAAGEFRTHLLHGVTGSGKTEVYLHCIRKILDDGGDVIYLVPELALTPQTVSRIRHGLDLSASDAVVWHSGLSEGERRDAWLAMSDGTAKVVIGARSAVFAPLKNVRLIVVDEEHETAYKQAETPRYHARDVAVYRAKICNAVCILGSATPSVESMFNASSQKYRLNTLKNRIDGSALPRIEIVNMRYEPNKIISSQLCASIHTQLENHGQTILFLNKRGYASTVFCNGCDYVAICPHCSTSLTYHKPQNLLRCHICGHVEELPSKCPKCGGHGILQSGVGTQKLVSVVAEMFPGARIERLDSDATATKHGFLKILERFGSGNIDILIGTQMIAKGLDFPNVSLVGIVNIDRAMTLPDFRANERAFQSIIQVSGRAGRGEKPGLVIIQTRCPDSELIGLAVKNDSERFLRNELMARSEFSYPPFSHVIRLIFSGQSEKKTEIFSKIFSDDLRKITKNSFEIRGPAPAVIQKINDRFRFSVVCFTKSVVPALGKIRQIVDVSKKSRDLSISIDVDPTEMM